MLRSASVFVVSIIILLAAFYLAERSLSPAFQGCMEKHQAADTNRIADDDITGRWIGLVENSIRCSGEFVEANSAAITALAAILVAALTATLWIATGRQAKLTRQAVMGWQTGIRISHRRNRLARIQRQDRELRLALGTCVGE